MCPPPGSKRFKGWNQKNWRNTVKPNLLACSVAITYAMVKFRWPCSLGNKYYIYTLVIVLAEPAATVREVFAREQFLFFDLGGSTLRELTQNILFLRSADCQEVWSVRWQMKMDAFTFRESRLLRNNWWSSKPPDGVRKTSQRHPQCAKTQFFS